MPLTRRQLYDYHDIDRGELKLIRIGHALWPCSSEKDDKSGDPSLKAALLARLSGLFGGSSGNIEPS